MTDSGLLMSGRERIRCKKATEIIFWVLHGYNSTIQYYQYAKKETMEKKIICLLLAVLCGLPVLGKWKANHVILIGLDGWGAYSVAKASNIPNLQSLMKGDVTP